MAKVITLSRFFPVYHPLKKEPTYFVEKFWKSIRYAAPKLGTIKGLENEVSNYKCGLGSDYSNGVYTLPTEFEPKHHTIRGGSRWEVGMKFSPRVWSEKPYNSPMITIAPDTEIFYSPKIEIFKTSEIIIDGKFYATFGTKKSRELAVNDGLSEEDLKNWFNYPKKDLLDYQIICWNKDLKY